MSFSSRFHPILLILRLLTENVILCNQTWPNNKIVFISSWPFCQPTHITGYFIVMSPKLTDILTDHFIYTRWAPLFRNAAFSSFHTNSQSDMRPWSSFVPKKMHYMLAVNSICKKPELFQFCTSPFPLLYMQICEKFVRK